jgi:pantoate--beta-alanine ligase
MKECAGIAELRTLLRGERSAGRRIGLVPTMGALHEGHLSLVDRAATRTDTVVMSVFVNPLQFGPQEDFARYPRDLDRDRKLAAGRGVSVLFTPEVATMYPAGNVTRVVAGPAGQNWEGRERPGHFDGVLTVVAKLFNIVEPDLAVFGQKDLQQATLIRQMVRDLDWPIEIVVAPTIRESDGLALSSRNAYLSSQDRAQGLGLSRALQAVELAWQGGERGGPALERLARDELKAFSGMTVDYIAVVDPERWEPVARAEAGTVVAVAGRVGGGGTRLLDNVILGQGTA